MDFEQSQSIPQEQSKPGTFSIVGWPAGLSLGTLLLSYPLLLVIAAFSKDAPGSDNTTVVALLAGPIMLFLIGVFLAGYTKRRFWFFLPHIMIAGLFILPEPVSNIMLTAMSALGRLIGFIFLVR